MLVTNGGKQALYNAFAALLDPGDEVLLPAPYWTTYPESIRLAGGVPGRDPDRRDHRLPRLDRAARGGPSPPRTKLLVFVSPSNPTGAVYSPAEVEAIGRWAVEKGIWVVTDEIYEHLVYGDAQFASMPALVPELADRCVVVNGVAKTYAMTGWRVGWMIGPADVVKAATNLQSHATSNVANVSQVAALAAVSGDLAAVAEMRVGLRPPTRQRSSAMLNAIPGVDLPRCPRAPSTSTRRSRACSAAASAGAWRSHVGRARRRSSSTRSRWRSCRVRRSARPGYLRLSYALGDDDLVEGVTRIATLLGE